MILRNSSSSKGKFDFMQKHQVTLTVRLKAKAGMGDRLQEMATKLIALTRREPGCINYYFHVDAKNPDLFMFYENWVDHQSLSKHLDMPYLKEFEHSINEILAEKEEFIFWQIVE